MRKGSEGKWGIARWHGFTAAFKAQMALDGLRWRDDPADHRGAGGASELGEHVEEAGVRRGKRAVRKRE